MAEAPGENKGRKKRTDGGITEDLIEGRLWVAFSGEIEHVPHADAHHSSGSLQQALH